MKHRLTSLRLPFSHSSKMNALHCSKHRLTKLYYNTKYNTIHRLTKLHCPERYQITLFFPAFPA